MKYPTSHAQVTLLAYGFIMLYILLFLAHGIDPDTTPYNSAGSLVVFCIAGFINGAGYAPTYAMTMAYIDDNAPGPGEHSASIYIG